MNIMGFTEDGHSVVQMVVFLMSLTGHRVSVLGKHNMFRDNTDPLSVDDKLITGFFAFPSDLGILDLGTMSLPHTPKPSI